MPSVRAQTRGDQRARIVDAARRLFASHGVDEVTMAEVATEAGVARATVFNYFGSKHALVEAITEDVIAYYQAMLQNALADTTTPVPALVRALFEHMGAGIEQFHEFYREVFREIMKIQVGLEEGSVAARAAERT
ncbi:MAG TPA: TetR/AcrR family transcriptional regulator, partial [Thermoleophilaceae bacterium]|nr:TetR/AcrR family transcriptional regulator [Thermoleophilaceae bacterium]